MNEELDQIQPYKYENEKINNLFEVVTETTEEVVDNESKSMEKAASL